MTNESPEDLNDFLAAPDSVRMNEAERKKYKLRKAQEEAERQQELNSKSKTPPSIEDFLADLRRVASDPDLNPFWEDKTLGQKRYKRFGQWSMEQLEAEFGQFEHAKQVAGLADKPGTRTQKAARASQSRKEHIGRYQERYMHPHVYDPGERELSHVECIVSISDTHATFLDPFTWFCFLRTIQELEPDYVYLNGDILEGAAISRHPKIPGWSVSMGMEFGFCREMMRQIREVYDGELIWGSGNHGLDRVAMYLSQLSGPLNGLGLSVGEVPDLRFDRLAGVEQYGVKLAQGGTIASPVGTEDHLPGTLFHGFNLVYHGHALGATPYLSELRDHGYSGQSGHTHRAGMAFATEERGGARCWMSTPMGCVPRAGRAYMFKKRNTGWQQGFGVCFMHPGGRVHQYPVVTSGGVCVIEGKVYENNFAEEPDPQKLWLPDFKL